MQKYTTKDISRFWIKVSITNNPDDCWIWQASCISKGYGRFQHGYKTYGAHRVSWMIAHGDIPDNLSVLHSCDNRKCVNPNHLFLGTQQDNIDDMYIKGRANPAKGETHVYAKLTDLQIAEIRQRYADGGISQYKLADEYGVGQQQISRIVNYKRRKG